MSFLNMKMTHLIIATYCLVWLRYIEGTILQGEMAKGHGSPRQVI